MPKSLLSARRIAGFAAGLAGLAVAAPSEAWEIVPHRAIYNLDLASTSSGADVSDVDGQMMFEWGDSCDGWVVEQRYNMDFLYSQGQEVDITSAYATWESKDGDDFSFNLRNTSNGQTDKELRGVAQQSSAGGSASFRIPDGLEHQLPKGVLFPTAHTLEMLTHAEAGDTIFHATLFDGTDEKGVSDVNAVIGRRIAPQDQNATSSLLAHHAAWPIALAFFRPEEKGELPEYEMSVRLYDNGIIDRMLINYGDFAVRAQLTTVEALDHPDC